MQKDDKMRKPVLYVNACVRKESRTAELAEKLLGRLDKPYEELCLEHIRFPVVNEEYINKRERLIVAGGFQNLGTITIYSHLQACGIMLGMAEI